MPPMACSFQIFHVSKGLPEVTISEEDQNKFWYDNTVGDVFLVFLMAVCDVYMHTEDGNELWEALNAKFSASDADSELYIMESFHDYGMVNNRSIV